MSVMTIQLEENDDNDWGQEVEASTNKITNGFCKYSEVEPKVHTDSNKYKFLGLIFH